MSAESEVNNLAQLFSALTQEGHYGLAVMANKDASEEAKADASAVVDLSTRKLHDLLVALEDDDA